MPNCPTCDKHLSTERGVKMHHAQIHNESIAGENVECHWCNSEFSVPPSRVERADKLFCPNKNCRGEWLSETNVAENHNNYNKKKYKCDQCGEDFMRIPSHVKGNHKFCKPGCSSKWQSENLRGENHPLFEGGGVEGFTKNEREEIFSRDNFSCQDCGDGQGGNLNAHHIIPKSKSTEKAHDVTNGITLCIDCHAERHDEPISSFILSQKR